MVKQIQFAKNGITELRDILCINPLGVKRDQHLVIYEFPRWFCGECGMVFQVKPTTPNKNRLDFDYQN